METGDETPSAEPAERPARAPKKATATRDPRLWFLISLLVLMASALSAGLAMRALTEAPGTNSYALLAQSWLDGRLDSETCFDGDCATYEGKTYVIFPPAPALVALPFVAASGDGADFRYFIPISLVLLVAIAFIWSRLYSAAGAGEAKSIVLLLALVFATPLFYVVLRGDKVWFFAQLVGFFFVSMALWGALVRRNAWLVGSMIAFAFLSRQMTILYLPLLYLLMLDEDDPLFRINRERIMRAVKMGAPVVAAVAAYCLYNYLRFGAPLETGYGYIAADVPPGEDNIISLRIKDLGLFSQDYLLFNTIYMFFQGLHVEFGGPYMTRITGVDPFGTSILAASPFLLLLFFAERHRIVFVGLLTVAAICGITLFYHSNGFSQYNVQRYALDWLPIAMLLLAPTVKSEWRSILALLVAYAMGLNLVTMAALKVSGTA